MLKTIAMKKKEANNSGFTLIEVMIAMCIFSVVMAAVYMTYREQLRSHYTQQGIMEMQQNIRAALYLMEREIKMAGLNPTKAAGIGITTADAHQLVFSMDFTGGAGNGLDDDDDFLVDEGSNGADDNGNGLFDEADEVEWYDGDANDPGEQVTYVLSNDANGNGVNDGLPNGTCDLLRNGEILALNIDALNFVYLDGNGVEILTPMAAADLENIRSIQVSIVARSATQPSPLTYEYVDTLTYRNQQNVTFLGPQNDAFRRLFMSIETRCRNMGL
jgi:type IV pilus assembly protein PilW